MYMAKNVSLWPSGLELYIIEKRSIKALQKQGGSMVPLGSVKILKNKNIQQTRKLN